MESESPYRITFTEFTIAFVPFAILLGTALLVPETTVDLGYYRTVYTIWATTALVTPALCAFALPGDSDRKRSLWLLFWTFSLLVYLVHASYAMFSVYHGSFEQFLSGQGMFPAINNGIFTAWWILDVCLAWFYAGNARWVHIERVAVHIYIGLTFFISTLFLKHGVISVLGGLYAISVLVCLLARFAPRLKSVTTS
jgi:hypothetical protein